MEKTKLQELLALQNEICDTHMNLHKKAVQLQILSNACSVTNKDFDFVFGAMVDLADEIYSLSCTEHRLFVMCDSIVQELYRAEEIK